MESKTRRGEQANLVVKVKLDSCLPGTVVTAPLRAMFQAMRAHRVFAEANLVKYLMHISQITTVEQNSATMAYYKDKM